MVEHASDSSESFFSPLGVQTFIFWTSSEKRKLSRCLGRTDLTSLESQISSVRRDVGSNPTQTISFFFFVFYFFLEFFFWIIVLFCRKILWKIFYRCLLWKYVFSVENWGKQNSKNEFGVLSSKLSQVRKIFVMSFTHWVLYRGF